MAHNRIGGTITRGEFTARFRAAYATATGTDEDALTGVFVVARTERRYWRWWLAAKSTIAHAGDDDGPPGHALAFVVTNCNPDDPDGGVVENWTDDEAVAFHRWASRLPGWGRGGPVTLLRVREEVP